jgi:hypothetical protein
MTWLWNKGARNPPYTALSEMDFAQALEVELFSGQIPHPVAQSIIKSSRYEIPTIHAGPVA